MTYRQITSEQRYMLAALRTQGSCAAEIARQRGCHRSTVGRELRRNRTPWDGHYRASKAQELCNGRRSRSPRNQQFSFQDLQKGDELLVERWSPEQISGRLATAATLSISTRRSVATFGETRRRAARFIRTCAAHRSDVGRVMAITIAAAAWPASATSPSAQRQPQAAANWVTGRSTR